MPYVIRKGGGKCPPGKPYAVMSTTTGDTHGCHATEASAQKQQQALYAQTGGRGLMESRATWTAAYVNNLPDSSFLYVEPGGSKDSEGKTTPRSLRHFPYKDANGKVDLPHLRNALARIPQSNLSTEVKNQIMAKARRIAADNGVGEGSGGGGGRSVGGSPIEALEQLEARMERRYCGQGGQWNIGGLVEVRQAEDGTWIGGYAAVFDRPSANLGGFVEYVRSSAYNKSHADGWPGVVCRFNHSDEHLLGTVSGRTLQLSIHETGLWYDTKPPKARADIVELVERRDVTRSSFAFRAIDEDWGLNDEGVPTRNLLELRLFDVAPVVHPAYIDTTVGVRAGAYESLARFKETSVDEVRSVFERDGDLRSFFVRKDKQGTAKPSSYEEHGPLFGPAAAALLDSKRDPWSDA